MKKVKIKLKDILWAIPMTIGAIFISIVWLPVVIYRSFKNSKNNKI
jgi:hypothetical protein